MKEFFSDFWQMMTVPDGDKWYDWGMIVCMWLLAFISVGLAVMIICAIVYELSDFTFTRKRVCNGTVRKIMYVEEHTSSILVYNPSLKIPTLQTNTVPAHYTVQVETKEWISSMDCDKVEFLHVGHRLKVFYKKGRVSNDIRIKQIEVL